MSDNEKLKQYIQPAVLSIVLFAILLTVVLAFSNYKSGMWKKDVRMDVLDMLSVRKSNLEKALYSRIYYTRGVAAYVALNPDISNAEYAQLAKEYIRQDSIINSMALSKDCIITSIYPLIDHKAALGLDLLSHPDRKAIVEKTIETHATFVAGPIELLEGGIAFVSYTPIFDKVSSLKETFWGVTDIVILRDRLFKEAGLITSDNEYSFALRGVDGTGNDGEIFWGDETIFNNNPVTLNIELPIGNWVLAAIPEEGWKQYADQDHTLLLLLITSASIISILIGLFFNVLLRIRYNERELKAIFASLDCLIMEYSNHGKCLKVATTNSKLLFLPEKQLAGKSLYQIFEKEQAEFFIKAIRECIHYKKIVTIEYSLSINNSKHWFSAQISYKNRNTVILNANDITDSKIREQQLVELNTTKDTLFSIISHDLRGPISTQKLLMNMIIENYETMDEPTRKNLLINLQESSSNLYKLLKSLLEWSLSQSGKIKIKTSVFSLNSQYKTIFTLLGKSAEAKGISFKNKLKDEASVYADKNLTEVILRNLISNAIKFTHSGGEITLHSEDVIHHNHAFCKISISDSGTGIKKERLNSIFQAKKGQVSLGTEDEKGNGLGLILCKEFTDKQNGEISVQSTLGQGSTFSLLLPKLEKNSNLS